MINDKGEIIGINNPKKLLEELPNKVRNLLGIIVGITLKKEENKVYLEIDIEAYPFPVSYKGQYHVRSGSTKQELKGSELDKFLLKKQGKHWDSVPVPHISIEDLDSRAFEHFQKKAIQSKRLTNIESNQNLLDKLHLRENQYLKRAGILLFHHDPEQYITGACVKIGYFQNDENLLFQDLISGNLFEQVERTMDLLLNKYLKAYIRYERIYRIEEYPFPEAALREALINAIVHKDYSSANPIQISVYSHKIIFWNQGQLPKNWTVEKLKQKHSSIPFNPAIASVFFRAGIIEAWGQGTLKIINECKKAFLPEPKFSDDMTSFSIEFKGILSKDSSGKGSGKSSGKILDYMLANNKITIPELAKKINISTRAIEKQIEKLKKEGKIKRLAGRKYGYWQISD